MSNISLEKEPMIIRGKHVLMGMLAFFGVIISVNLVFVYFALGTWTGLSTENAYQKGLNYNETIAARDAQRALGWQGAVTVEAAADGSELLTVVLRDHDGRPLPDLIVSAQLRRPTNENYDESLTLEEGTAGAYSATLSLPLRGNWDLTLSASRAGAAPEATPFEMKTRLWLN